jgi:hypothetical protein
MTRDNEREAPESKRRGEDERVSFFDVSGDPFGVPEAETDRHLFGLVNNP